MIVFTAIWLGWKRMIALFDTLLKLASSRNGSFILDLNDRNGKIIDGVIWWYYLIGWVYLRWWNEGKENIDILSTVVLKM